MKTIIYYMVYIRQPSLGLESQFTYELPLTSEQRRLIVDAISRALEEDEMATFHNVLRVGSISED